MRDRSGFSGGPTARDSMLKPRRLNSAETRARTPDLFSTSTESVWRLIPTFLSDAIRHREGPRSGARAERSGGWVAPPGHRPEPARGGEEGVLSLPLVLSEDGPHVARGQDV